MRPRASHLRRFLQVIRRYAILLGITAAVSLLAGIATAAASPVTVTSTPLVLPPVGQKTAAAANGEPGPFTATQEVMAGSDPVLSGALPDVRPAVSLTGLRRDIQIRSLTPYVISVTAQGETAGDAEATASAVARSYIQYVVLPAARPGACRRTCLSRPPARPGRRRSCGCLLARCSGAVSGVMAGLIAAVVSRRLAP